jgi:hypothetical protein
MGPAEQLPYQQYTQQMMAMNSVMAQAQLQGQVFSQKTYTSGGAHGVPQAMPLPQSVGHPPYMMYAPQATLVGSGAAAVPASFQHHYPSQEGGQMFAPATMVLVNHSGIPYSYMTLPASNASGYALVPGASYTQNPHVAASGMVANGYPPQTGPGAYQALQFSDSAVAGFANHQVLKRNHQHGSKASNRQRHQGRGSLGGRGSRHSVSYSPPQHQHKHDLHATVPAQMHAMSLPDAGQVPHQGCMTVQRSMSLGSPVSHWNDQDPSFYRLPKKNFPARCLGDTKGVIMDMVSDQVGCRRLQQLLDSSLPGHEQDVTAVLEELRPILGDLAEAPFGNYVFQKLMGCVTPAQRLSTLIALGPRLVTAGQSLHGTRCVQRLIRSCAVDNVAASAATLEVHLKGYMVTLSLNSRGSHVVQCCLEALPENSITFLYDELIKSLFEVATHRHGCCVIQRCIEVASHDRRLVMKDLVEERGLELMLDPFGNYVVQRVLNLFQGEDSRKLCSAITGQVAKLSCHKFSSNVIESCLKVAPDDLKTRFVQELIEAEAFKDLMADRYANYIVQRALLVAVGEQAQQLVDRCSLFLSDTANPGVSRIATIIQKQCDSALPSDDATPPPSNSSCTSPICTSSPRP